ncbi:MAG: chemotaxis protein CheA [Treponema sp.]|nr:MAG: chemotaxis protein CheA [Treponema sp.]
MSDYLDINNEELLKDFFSEAEQQVETLESNILVIEQDPENHDAVDEIFRAAHTLKGGSATVEMNELATFTHAMEDLLDEIRNGKVKVTESVVDMLLSAIDIIKAMLEARQDGEVYSEDVSGITDKLRSHIGDTGKKAVKAPATKPKKQVKKKPEASGADSSMSLSEYERLEITSTVPQGHSTFEVNVKFDEDNQMNSVGGIQVFASLKRCASVLKTMPDFDELYEDIFHENVVYLVSSDADIDTIENAAFISDVTLSVDAKKVCLSQECAVNNAEPIMEDVKTKKEPVTVAKPEAKIETEKNDTPVKKQKKPATTTGASTHSTGSSILRVDSKRIDYLLNLVSEIVITKASFNQSATEFSDLYSLFQSKSSSYKEQLRKLLEKIPAYLEKMEKGYDINAIKKDLSDEYLGMFDLFTDFEGSLKRSVTKFRSSSQNLGRISGELQEGVMKIRMVPISQIFSRFPRVVRDLSKDLNKNVNLIIEGEDTELDKSVVEDLLDPIMHCVRNSLDHGIESPQDRKKLGKPEQGSLLLRATNEGNMIVIEIADDGHGIDVEAVKRKAIQRGVIHPNKNLSDVEAYQLIFAPGFSTNTEITNVSGRGVGLDVVKTYIEKLNGSVTVESELNHGTRFVIKLPLTLAIIQALLIRVGDEVYSVPIASVIESLRVTNDEINRIDNYEVFNCREEVISLLRLNRLFGIRKAQEAHEDGHNYIVIVGTEEKKVGLMVDSLIGEESIVIKPLTDHFTNSPGIAGASILGDGSVSLIIDVAQLLGLGMKQELMARERRDASVW